jgi:hypothetical protein
MRDCKLINLLANNFFHDFSLESCLGELSSWTELSFQSGDFEVVVRYVGSRRPFSTGLQHTNWTRRLLSTHLPANSSFLKAQEQNAHAECVWSTTPRTVAAYFHPTRPSHRGKVESHSPRTRHSSTAGHHMQLQRQGSSDFRIDGSTVRANQRQG